MRWSQQGFDSPPDLAGRPSAAVRYSSISRKCLFYYYLTVPRTKRWRQRLTRPGGSHAPRLVSSRLAPAATPAHPPHTHTHTAEFSQRIRSTCIYIHRRQSPRSNEAGGPVVRSTLATAVTHNHAARRGQSVLNNGRNSRRWWIVDTEQVGRGIQTQIYKHKNILS